MINQRLDKSAVPDLVELSGNADFPYPLTESAAYIYCKGTRPLLPTTQTYGMYYDGVRLVSVMTATFCYIFPYADCPGGKAVYISGAYTHPDFRNRRCATHLLEAIERDAAMFGADYLCCDSAADGLCEKYGFIRISTDKIHFRKPVKK